MIVLLCWQRESLISELVTMTCPVGHVHSSRCTQFWKKVVVVGENLSCSSSSHQAEHQSLSQRTGGQCSGGAAGLVGTEGRLIKSDPPVRCSLITFSPVIHRSSFWRGGSNLRPGTLSWSTWVTLLMSERAGRKFTLLSQEAPQATPWFIYLVFECCLSEAILALVECKNAKCRKYLS